MLRRTAFSGAALRCDTWAHALGILIRIRLETLRLEVKDTDMRAPRFFLTRNERKCSADPSWRLAMVIEARTSPALQLWTAAEVEELFVLNPLAWECTGRLDPVDR